MAWETPSVAAGPAGLVCTVDRVASEAGASVLAAGGNAVDGAVAASAALAVTTPHMCGMGGDLFALVHGPLTGSADPLVLNASGRAGSGADAARLRAEGHTVMPFRGDVRAAPVPGCVDGWVTLHGRLGRLPLADVLAPAIGLATDGFAISPLLAFMLPALADVDGVDELTSLDPGSSSPVTRPGPARLLRAIVDGGRAAFYEGEFGDALLAVGAGEYAADDLARSQADWVDGLAVDAWGHRVWTVPPSSQGYLTLAAAWIAEHVGAPPDPTDGLWAHATVEAARLAGADRPALLHDRADGEALLAPSRLAALAGRYRPDRAVPAAGLAAAGGTIYLGVCDGEGGAVSLIQSNASGFGSHVAVPGTGVLLHNRGVGFSLEAGHPAEYQPGRRPPHTLSPALVTRADGSLRAVLGTMGGDVQPQVVLQLLARLLATGEDPGTIIGAGRWMLTAPGGNGFDLWARAADHRVTLEAHAPLGWDDALAERGHRVERRTRDDPAGFGHAQLIDMGAEGGPAGAADPRSIIGAAVPADQRASRDSGPG